MQPIEFSCDWYQGRTLSNKTQDASSKSEDASSSAPMFLKIYEICPGIFWIIRNVLAIF